MIAGADLGEPIRVADDDFILFGGDEYALQRLTADAFKITNFCSMDKGTRWDALGGEACAG